ncbi:hypothetical protein GCM10020254_78790 [Streptomyces goshikiensis]
MILEQRPPHRSQCVADAGPVPFGGEQARGAQDRRVVARGGRGGAGAARELGRTGRHRRGLERTGAGGAQQRGERAVRPGGAAAAQTAR